MALGKTQSQIHIDEIKAQMAGEQMRDYPDLSRQNEAVFVRERFWAHAPERLKVMSGQTGSIVAV